VFYQPFEAFVSEIISLDAVRARRLPVILPHPAASRPVPAESMLRASADMWLADSVREAAQEIVNHITRTNAPLEPNERAALMRASAALLGQPEGVC
jgi:hypothetical protein